MTTPSEQPLATLSRWAPVPMLVASVVVGWSLSGLFPASFQHSLPVAAVVLVFRVVVAIVDPDLGPRAGAVLVAGNLTLTGFGCLFNPLMSIYGFAGYLDIDRYLPPRPRVAGVVGTALVIAVGQAGGIPGVANLPLLYGGLAVVNVAIALTMFGRANDRERQAREREAATAALAQAHEANARLQQELAETARERGITEERARLSRELHDTVAQGIVGVIRQLDAVNPSSLDAEARTRVQRATTSARDCLVDARRAVRALAPKELSERSLPEAVHDLARTWARAHRIAIEVDTDEFLAESPHEDTVVRVVQESLTNIARHSGAGSVHIVLRGPGPAVELLIEDDGAGFDPGQPSVGLGRAGMAARVAAAGGTLVVESSPGAGCRVKASLP